MPCSGVTLSSTACVATSICLAVKAAKGGCWLWWWRRRRLRRHRDGDNSAHLVDIQHNLVLRDGKRLCYMICGESSFPVVFHLEGTLAGAALRNSFLETTVRVVGVEWPGNTHLTPGELLSVDLLELADVLGVDTFGVAGGRSQALEVASALPRRCCPDIWEDEILRRTREEHRAAFVSASSDLAQEHASDGSGERADGVGNLTFETRARFYDFLGRVTATEGNRS
eukprot:TRINITY_DN31224_c0_g1_i1.p1 TRINITY_DN31224_c0_g1~~TRINITY_DN31224_c0_g1_i1.p1  ORF type:complete len:243 (-),score=28.79 TRINITY_DN31224_c0_g1_i1:11-688(-)